MDDDKSGREGGGVVLLDPEGDLSDETLKLRLYLASDSEEFWELDLTPNQWVALPYAELFDRLIKTQAIPELVFWVVIQEEPQAGIVAFNTLGQFSLLLSGPTDTTETFWKVVRSEDPTSVTMRIVVPNDLPFDSLGFKNLRNNSQQLARLEERFRKPMQVWQNALIQMHLQLENNVFDPFTSEVAGYLNFFLNEYLTSLGPTVAIQFAEVGVLDRSPSRGFVRMMLETACKLYGQDLAQLDQAMQERSGVSAPSDTELFWATAVLMKAVMVVGTVCYYSSDRDRLRGNTIEVVERMQHGTRSLLGQQDCEDSAKEIFAFAKGLPVSFGLAGFERLHQSFEYLMITGAATSPSLGGKMAHGEFICHVWSLAVPKSIFRIWTSPSFSSSSARNSTLPTLSPFEAMVKRHGCKILEGTNEAWMNYDDMENYFQDKAAARKIRDRFAHEDLVKVALEREFPSLRTLTSQIRRNFSERVDLSDPFSVSIFYYAMISAWHVTNWGEEEGDLIEYQFVKNGKISIKIIDAVRGDPDVSLVPISTKQFLDRKERMLMIRQVLPRVRLSRKKQIPKPDAISLPDSIARREGVRAQIKESRKQPTGSIVYSYSSPTSLTLDQKGALIGAAQSALVKSYESFTARITTLNSVHYLIFNV